MTANDLVEYILAADDRGLITMGRTNYYRFSLVLLQNFEKVRIDPDNDDPDYIIELYEHIAGNDYSYEGYDEYYSVVVDGTKMGTIFKRIDDSE